jgi:hypothetical protein
MEDECRELLQRFFAAKRQLQRAGNQPAVESNPEDHGRIG